MTTAPKPEPEFDWRIAGEKDNRLDRWLDTASGWFSPLLVKETRQALKSRQFVITFFLLMAIVVACLIVAVTLTSDLGSIDFSYGLLSTFLVVLGFPLFIIIPFSAFRSLASEYEDGTLQLVSVTAMKPYQIIIGKFGSSLLQMLVYLAVLAPCISFTYLLRGLDVRVILYCLLFCTVSSITLTSVGLFAGAITYSRALGAGIAVLLLLLLGFAYFMWLTFVFTGARELPQLLALGGKIGLDAFFGATITTAILAFTASASILTFYADNRATKLRIAMLLQQTVFLGWTTAMLTYTLETYAWYFLHHVFCHYWVLMGAMMCFVPAGTSHRVRRSLPSTTLPKACFSLFFPGPGRGFMFAVCNLFAGTLFLALIAIFAKLILPELPSNIQFGQSLSDFSSVDMHHVLLMLFGNLVYATFYLCIVFLIGRIINRYTRKLVPVAGALILFIVAFFSLMLGLLIQFNFQRSSGYTLIQILNWYWTMAEVAQSSSDSLLDLAGAFLTGNSELIAVSLMSVLTLALLFISMLLASRDLQESTVAVPERVAEDKKENAKTPEEKETIADVLGELPPRPEDHEATDGSEKTREI